jgi:hypothetical protein
VELRGLVVRRDLQDLLVERRRLRVEAVLEKVIGNPGVLCDRLVGLVRAYVQIAERVRGVPVARLVLDHAYVLDDGGVEAPLTKQLFRFFQRVFTIQGQRLLHVPPEGFSYASMVSNRDGGRNERRWTSE